jgi:sugar fermentation stimulation protein A
MIFDHLIEGVLQRRYKRFLADVELASGEVITVHCPNTGAMTGCAEPGSRVWLSRSDSPSRKYPHTWELVETREGLACIRSVLANKVVGEALEAGKVPQLDEFSNLRREVKYGANSRVDFLLECGDRQIYVEVKSVTLCRGDGLGAFPDAVSARGTKHLLELGAVRGGNTRAVLFFCVFHTGINRVTVAEDIDPVYAQALAEAVASGVEIMAWQAEISPMGIELARPLPLLTGR